MLKRNMKNLFVLLACLYVFVGCAESSQQLNIEPTPDASITELPVENTQIKINEEEVSETVITDLNIVNPKIIVKKAERLLYLLDGDTVVATYKIGLGFTPEGHKLKEGDGKTPEGEYYICVKNPNSRFYLSLGISYPNKQDAKTALDDGRIDSRTYHKIAKAIDEGKIPPWNTPLGGEIMIHGNGSSRDWTAGCIAVDNEVMDLLFDICDVGTSVTIS